MTKEFSIVGKPESLEDARALALEDPYQFQLWALGLVNARPPGLKKGADKGIDGRLYFHDEHEGGKTNQIILSVKSGHLKPEYVRELPSIVDRERASIGVLISLEKATQPMRSEAASAGFYTNSWWGKFPKIQLLPIEELLNGKRLSTRTLARVIGHSSKPQPRKRLRRKRLNYSALKIENLLFCKILDEQETVPEHTVTFRAGYFALRRFLGSGSACRSSRVRAFISRRISSA